MALTTFFLSPLTAFRRSIALILIALSSVTSANEITIASGEKGGLYHQFAQQLQAKLTDKSKFKNGDILTIK